MLPHTPPPRSLNAWWSSTGPQLGPSVCGTGGSLVPLSWIFPARSPGT